jgi:hypothetical protein
MISTSADIILDGYIRVSQTRGPGDDALRATRYYALGSALCSYGARDTVRTVSSRPPTSQIQALKV